MKTKRISFITTFLLAYFSYALNAQSWTGDTVTSTGGKLLINSTTVNVSGGLNAVTIKASDTIASTGVINAGNLNVTGSSVTMPGLVIDTNTDVMSIDAHGHVTPLSRHALQVLNIVPWPPIPFGPCTSVLTI